MPTIYDKMDREKAKKVADTFEDKSVLKFRWPTKEQFSLTPSADGQKPAQQNYGSEDDTQEPVSLIPPEKQLGGRGKGLDDYLEEQVSGLGYGLVFPENEQYARSLVLDGLKKKFDQMSLPYNQDELAQKFNARMDLEKQNRMRQKAAENIMKRY